MVSLYRAVHADGLGQSDHPVGRLGRSGDRAVDHVLRLRGHRAGVVGLVDFVLAFVLFRLVFERKIRQAGQLAVA